MDVFGARQRLRADLRGGADHHQLPLRPQRRDAGDDIHIHAFIDHAKEPDAGMRNLPLIIGINAALSRALEVSGVDAARKNVNVVVSLTFGFVQALSADEHEIAFGHQLSFEIENALRRSSKRGKLIHIVIDAQVGREMASKLKRHGRIVPANPSRRPHISEQLVYDSMLRVSDFVW